MHSPCGAEGLGLGAVVSSSHIIYGAPSTWGEHLLRPFPCSNTGRKGWRSPSSPVLTLSLCAEVQDWGTRLRKDEHVSGTLSCQCPQSHTVQPRAPVTLDFLALTSCLSKSCFCPATSADLWGGQWQAATCRSHFYNHVFSFFKHCVTSQQFIEGWVETA